MTSFEKVAEPSSATGDHKYLDVKLPTAQGLGWVLKLIKWTWLPLGLAVAGRWISSILQVLGSSLIAFVVVQLGNSDQTGIVLPNALVEWLRKADSPILAALALTFGITAFSALIDIFVAWTRVWVHLIVNRRVTAQVVDISIRTNTDTTLDAATAVQRWLLKVDIVYFLHESIAATIGHIGTIVIAVAATYYANKLAGNVSLICLLLWIAVGIPLTIRTLRANREYAITHEEVGRVIRDGIALRADFSRPSWKEFWLRRSVPQLTSLQRSIRRQGLWGALLEGILSGIARLMPVAAVVAAILTGSIGSAVAILLYLSRVAGPLGGLAGILPWIQQNLISVQRMYSMIFTPGSAPLVIPDQYKVEHQLSVREWSVRVGPERLIEYPEITAANDSILCVVGPSGSGKSTLLKSLSGQLKRETGSLALDGESIDPESTFWQETCSLVPQEPELLPGRIKDNLDGFPNWKRTERLSATTDHLLADTSGGMLCPVGIDDKGVSVGQRRVIAVLRSLGTDARVVLLDEPVSGVDDSIVCALKGAIEEVQRDGRIVILSAHEHDFRRLGFGTAQVVRLGRLSEDYAA